MKSRLNLKFVLLSVLLFLVEVLIATVFRDFYFVRAFGGDVLVVILLYSIVSSFFEVRNKGLLLFGIFIFAVGIEILQYFKIADLLGFEEGSIPYIMIGNYFSWEDIFCYGTGCLLVYIMEKWKKKL